MKPPYDCTIKNLRRLFEGVWHIFSHLQGNITDQKIRCRHCKNETKGANEERKRYMFTPFLHTVRVAKGSLLVKVALQASYSTNLVNANAVPVAKSHGGTQRSKDVVVPYPRVAERVGKYELKDKDTTMNVIVRASHQTFQSTTARRKPGHRPRNLPCSLLSSN